ncbi:MAG: hypothetical protein H3C58_03265 [Fimbriimonadaceae bacterium]|nr:hypothetical protein [Fimbriimonadaceae bacterium]
MNKGPFETIIETLAATEARFVIIGGIALRLHGSSYVTQDVDIFYPRSPEDLEILVQAVNSLNPSLRLPDGSIPYRLDVQALLNGANFTLTSESGDLDLLAYVGDGIDFDGVFERASVFELYGHHVRVASLTDLLDMKKAAGRPKDLAHLAEIHALQSLAEEAKE